MYSPRQIATVVLLSECSKKLEELVKINLSSADDYDVPPPMNGGWTGEHVRRYEFDSTLEDVELLLKAIAYNFDSPPLRWLARS